MTIREKKLSHLLERVDEDHRVDLLAMPKLVEFAEREEFDSPAVKEYITSQFGAFDKSKYCALVLGCTHFNYFKPSYREYFGKDTLLVDGNSGTVRHLADVLSLKTVQDIDMSFDKENEMSWMKNTEYYFSGKEISGGETLEHLKRLHLRLEKVRNI